jgi:hypothetical protein
LPVIVNGTGSDIPEAIRASLFVVYVCLPRARAGFFLEYVAAVSQGNRE